MSHRDQDGHTGSASHAQDLSAAVEWLLQGVDEQSIRLREDCGWTVKGLLAASLLWAWSDEAALTRRFTAARKIAARLLPRAVPSQVSYQAFTKLLVRWTVPLMAAVILALRARMRTSLAARYRTAGYVVFGGDGSRLALPRTAANEAEFSPQKSRTKKHNSRRKTKNKTKKSKGGGRQSHRRGRRPRSAEARAQRARQKKADSPQLWITTLWHAGSGLPWDWRIGPSDSSERHQLREMIDALPPDALVAADAGFVGYEFWKDLLDAKREFVIRVGANVRLLKKLGMVRESAGTVYVWPREAARKEQPPLVLRLVVLQGGRHPWYLLTSVRAPSRLSDRQVAEIYELRWGIELYYRHFKQTFNRHKLRSHTPAHVQIEAHWSMLGLWALLLHAQQHLHRRHVPLERISVAAVLHAYRTAMREYKSHPDPGESLWELLNIALIDTYSRTNKASRGHPRKKHQTPAGAPKVQNATREQIAMAQQIKNIPTQKGLTA